MERKIIFIHHGGSVAGSSISFLQLAAELDKTIYSPLALFSESGPILKFANDLGVEAKVIPFRSAFYHSDHVPFKFRLLVPFINNYRSTVRMAEMIAYNEKPDLVHLNTSVLIPMAIGVKRAGIPLVWHVREAIGPNRVIRKWQIKKISQLANRIIVTSNYVKQLFPRSAQVQVVPNAINNSFYNMDETVVRNRIREELGITIDAPVVTMIGSVQAVKGHYLLFEAAKEIVNEHPNVRFLIIAGGVDSNYVQSWKRLVKYTIGMPLDNLERMQRLISQAGLSRNFIFTGYRKDIPELLAATDIVAFLSQKAEGFGRPLIEAMAAGCPVLATDVGPSREILGEGTSVFIPPGETKAIAVELIKLLNNPSKYKQMGINGRKRVLKYFRMKMHVSKISKIYDSIFMESGSY